MALFDSNDIIFLQVVHDTGEQGKSVSQGRKDGTSDNNENVVVIVNKPIEKGMFTSKQMNKSYLQINDETSKTSVNL